MQFSDLPLEVRLKIWALTLEEEEPEICFFNILDFHLPDDFLDDEEDDEDLDYELSGDEDKEDKAGRAERKKKKDAEDVGDDGDDEDDDEDDEYHPEDRKVLIGFPAAMHVCRESRALAEERLDFKPVDWSPKGAEEEEEVFEVPCREYRPELDVLFVPLFDQGMLMGALQSAEEHGDDFASRIARIAVPAQTFLPNNEDLELAWLVQGMPSLQSVHVVFGDYPGSFPAPGEDDDDDDDKKGGGDKDEDDEDDEDFDDECEGGRFTLQKWTDETAELVPGDATTSISPELMLADVGGEILASLEQESKRAIKFEASRIVRRKPYV